MVQLKNIIHYSALIFLIIVQKLLIGFALSSVDYQSLPEPSLVHNVLYLPHVLFMVAPTLIVFLWVRRQSVYERNRKTIRILFIVFSLFIVDVTWFVGEGYSVYGTALHLRTELFQGYAQWKDPEKDGAVRLLSDSNSYLYNQETEELYHRSDTRVDKIDRIEDNEPIDILYTGSVRLDNEQNESIDINVLQVGENSPAGNIQPLTFRINQGDSIYSIANDVSFQRVDDFYDVYVESAYQLSGDGNTIHFEQVSYPNDSLGIQMDTKGIVYVRNNEVTLIKSLKDNESNEMDERYVGADGDWQAYLNAYSEHLDGYVKISNILEWTYE